MWRFFEHVVTVVASALGRERYWALATKRWAHEVDRPETPEQLRELLARIERSLVAEYGGSDPSFLPKLYMLGTDVLYESTEPVISACCRGVAGYSISYEVVPEYPWRLFTLRIVAEQWGGELRVTAQTHGPYGRWDIPSRSVLEALGMTERDIKQLERGASSAAEVDLYDLQQHLRLLAK